MQQQLGASASSGHAGRCFWAFPGVLILVPGRFLKCFIPGFSFFAFSLLVLGFWAFAGKGVAGKGAAGKGAAGKGIACKGVASSSSIGFKVTRQSSAVTRPPTVALLVNYSWRVIVN
jgi:hypothetical protein